MKRILQIVPDMRSGGLETFIMNLYRNVDRTQIQFDFLVHYEREAFYDKEIEALGGRIYRLSFREDNRFIKYIRDLKHFFARHPEYDIVHGHMGSLACFYLRYAKKYGVRTRIIHSHNTDTEKTVKGYLKGLLLKASCKYANVKFACSKQAGEFLFGDREFQVINNGIIVDNFHYKEALRQEIRKINQVEQKLIIGHVGRFCIQKNHKFLIDIFAQIHNKVKDSQLWLVGEGELAEKVKRQVMEQGLEQYVKFWGVQKDVSKIYQAMDVFVLPSLFEGLGIVNIEAQTSGLYCVVSDQIPKVVDVTGNVEFVSLDKTAKEWAEIILSHTFCERKDCQRQVKEAGFDIKSEASKIQAFYLKS